MNLAFNQHREFKVDEEVGVTIKFPVRPTRGRSISAWNWEIVDTFLHRHHITPDWINCNGSWGALGMTLSFLTSFSFCILSEKLYSPLREGVQQKKVRNFREFSLLWSNPPPLELGKIK